MLLMLWESSHGRQRRTYKAFRNLPAFAVERGALSPPFRLDLDPFQEERIRESSRPGINRWGVSAPEHAHGIHPRGSPGRARRGEQGDRGEHQRRHKVG